MPAECREFFGRSLFFVGEFGFNDYTISLYKGKSIPQVRPFVPEVISTIPMAIQVTMERATCKCNSA
jgi:hypothetical protein